MNLLKIIIINLVVFIGLSVLVEIFFGGWIFKDNDLNNLGILRNIVLVFDHELYDTSKVTMTYSRDKYGLRGKSTFNRPDKIDILTVGGSTTDQCYIDDSLTWQSHLEKFLKKKYCISNAGLAGQSTVGHIKSFELWFPKIKDLKPKYILFYVGINDLFVMNEGNSYDRISLKPLSIADKMKNKSVFYNLYRRIEGMVKAEKLHVRHSRIDFSKLEYTDQPLLQPELLQQYEIQKLGSFKNRIQILINKSIELGAIPIFVTQPTFKYKLINNKLLGLKQVSYFKLDKDYAYNGVDYYNLLCLLNKSIRDVCNAKYQVIDLSSPNYWNESDFYDRVHMTPKGTEKLAYEISKQIDLK